ncbi:hypothetical protein KAR28_04465 [Candidatus Parcubacteria bacterium]|nr:hypothetical protein [Candidatus Parcubacteria bacterium]
MTLSTALPANNKRRGANPMGLSGSPSCLSFPPAPDMHVIIEEVQNGYLVKVYTNIFEMQSGAEPREKFVSLDIDHMLCGLTQIYQEHEKAKTKHKIKLKEYEAKQAEKRI